jgi:hypothetical protein
MKKFKIDDVVVCINKDDPTYSKVGTIISIDITNGQLAYFVAYPGFRGFDNGDYKGSDGYYQLETDLELYDPDTMLNTTDDIDGKSMFYKLGYSLYDRSENGLVLGFQKQDRKSKAVRNIQFYDNQYGKNVVVCGKSLYESLDGHSQSGVTIDELKAINKILAVLNW